MTAAELLKKEEGIGALVSVKRGCWMYGLRKAVPQVISNLCMVGYLDRKVKVMILISSLHMNTAGTLVASLMNVGMKF